MSVIENDSQVCVVGCANKRLDVLGMAMAHQVTGGQTRDHFTVFEITAPPGISVPLHTHPQSEAFYILSGSVEFGRSGKDGPETFTADAGQMVHIPGGLPHSFCNVSGQTAPMLVISEASLERFFYDLGQPLDQHQEPAAGPPTQEQLKHVHAVMTAHGQVLLGPHPRA